jgi:hypothetical protein
VPRYIIPPQLSSDISQGNHIQSFPYQVITSTQPIPNKSPRTSPRATRTSRKRLRSVTLETDIQWIASEQRQEVETQDSSLEDADADLVTIQDQPESGFGTIWKGIQQLFR